MQGVDNFDKIIASMERELDALAEEKAERMKAMMAARAPRSNEGGPGYVHFADNFEVRKVAPMIWEIINDKMVGKNGDYPLWKLLEHGSRYTSPQKSVGPARDIVGPEFIQEAARVGRG